jgi:hypothetical protein
MLIFFGCIIIVCVLLGIWHRKKIVTDSNTRLQQQHHDTSYFGTPVSYYIPSFDPTNIYINARIPIESLPKILPSDTSMKNLLCKNNKIYMRRAHYSHDQRPWLVPTFYQTAITLCPICMKKLDMHALFVGKYYFCFSCLIDTIIPIQMLQKFLLLRELFNDPSQLITRYMICLNFDVNQIMEYKYECDKCRIFVCKTKVKCDFIMDDFILYLRSMMKNQQ